MKLKNIITLLIFLVFALPLISQDNFLIIAPDDFIDELQGLKNYKDCTGRPATLVNLTWVDNNFTGSDLPEKVKKCIDYYRQNNNILYAMLVGDCDKFPVRYCRAYNTEWGSKYYPSDLYYADLYNSSYNFDDWDGDNDGIIGEMDFSGGTNISLVNLDGIDMYPDIALARVPASTGAEVTTYVNKIIDYELKAPGSWFNNAMLVVDGHVGPFGDTVKVNEDVVPHLTSSSFNIIKRYMDNALWTGQTYATRSAEINTRLNSGVGFVNYYGHGVRLEWCNKYEDGWYDYTKISSLTNEHKLPVMFASACFTGRFHFDREYYMDINGVEWNRLGGPYPVVNFPEPMAIQPTLYDSYGSESLAEHFLVKNNSGGIGYIGVTSKSEHGMWMSNPSESIGLAPYFFEDYDNGNRTLGILWENAMSEFVSDVEIIAMSQYAFIHIHKVQLFGDPSLTVGGRYINNLSGNMYDGWGGPWYSFSRGRVVGNVTVPSGQALTVNNGVSILFDDGKKITGMDPNYGYGLVVNGTQNAPVCFFSLSAEPQADYFLHGMKTYGQTRLRNGGEIKLY
ncbi:MAG: hypothetical protein H8D45_30170 [Bacteroidetes bacterium]|nr:hypothetical protein [Bacteroidota bacterium]MBL7103970.1 hypothetical protein [Bacteroidales bacterium]